MAAFTPARCRALVVAFLLFLTAVPAFAGRSPWEDMVQNLEQAFTGPIGRGLSLVAIVVTGLTFAFGEPGGKRALAGVGFGLAMVIGAAQWLRWLTG